MDVTLKRVKRSALGALRSAGLFQAWLNSGWRRERLLILCYHGIAIDDEHEWNPSFFMPQSLLAQRLQALKDARCNVLPLGEALSRLYERTLPPRSVCLTFDDGMYDFKLRALPLLQRHGFPSTVYLTTYYCRYAAPVFNPFVQYLMWKARVDSIDARPITGVHETWDTRTVTGRHTALEALLRFAEANQLDGREKHELAVRLGRHLGLDVDEILRRRILQLLNPQEVADLGGARVDFQLHTHRHVTPLDRTLFLREIVDNRDALRKMVPVEPRHFCYPRGYHHPAFLPWLAEAGVASATTAVAGLATPTSNPLTLPRVIDTVNLAPIEFEGWLTGVSTLIPRRSHDVNAP